MVWGCSVCSHAVGGVGGQSFAWMERRGSCATGPLLMVPDKWAQWGVAPSSCSPIQSQQHRKTSSEERSVFMSFPCNVSHAHRHLSYSDTSRTWDFICMYTSTFNRWLHPKLMCSVYHSDVQWFHNVLLKLLGIVFSAYKQSDNTTFVQFLLIYVNLNIFILIYSLHMLGCFYIQYYNKQ